MSENIVFPIALLDQRTRWIDVQGNMWRIADFNEDTCLWALNYVLANASELRRSWAMLHKTEIDDKEHARRWMLKRTVVRQLMARLLDIEAQQRRVDLDEYFAK